MIGDIHRRAVIAAILALVYPGLGHAYLRAWGRALLWFGAVVATAVLLIPSEIMLGVTESGDILSAWDSVPTEAMLGIVLVAAFNAIDAYWTANRMRLMRDETRCPTCGRPVDEDLSFCHWCTAEFSGEPA